MPEKIILVSGASAVGKTAVLRALIPALERGGIRPCVCKIDCLKTEDHLVYRNMGLPCVTGLSGDICPDHFLVSNLPELWNWADEVECNTLLIETAGLCHRCSPATEQMIAGCILDCTSSSRAPESLGPMLTQADFIVMTKIDMVSQAEREIIAWQLRKLNRKAKIFPVDGLTGYGAETLASWLLAQKAASGFEEDSLRHTMPGGVCSYCVGEMRVGSAYQQGVVGKISFGNQECEYQKCAEFDECPEGDETHLSENQKKILSGRTLTIEPGHDKYGNQECWKPFTMTRGDLYAIVGNTGSGKSRLMKDMEQLARKDTVTGRSVLLDGKVVSPETRMELSAGLIAHLGQNMRFMLDTTVEEFLNLHLLCRGKHGESKPYEQSEEDDANHHLTACQVIRLANCITPEPIAPADNLNLLSGGQTRALMIADIAMVCDSPIVLIDEIENAGIDKELALEILLNREKLVLVVTHDIHTALMAPRRIIMEHGAIRSVLDRTLEEENLFQELSMQYHRQQQRQKQLRKGEPLT